MTAAKLVNGELDPDRPFLSAHKHLQAGWPVFALPPGAKFPPPSGATGWRGKDLTTGEVEELQRRTPKANVGIRAPAGVVGIDVDAYGSKRGGVTLAALEAELGPLPPAPVSTARSDMTSGIRWFRVPQGVVLAGVLGPGIEVVQRHHRYAAAPPSAHHTGNPYRWMNPDWSEAAAVPSPADLPELPAAWLERFRVEARPGGGSPASDGMVAVWLDAHDRDVACDRLTAEVDGFAEDVGDGIARHDAMLKRQLAVVSIAHAGHRGGTDALELLFERFAEALGDDRDPDVEWASGLAGAVGIVHGNPPRAGGCCPTPTGKPPVEDVYNAAESPDHYLGLFAGGCVPLTGTYRFGERWVCTPHIGEAGYRAPVDPGDHNGPAMVLPLDALGAKSFTNSRVWLYREHVLPSGRRVRERTFGWAEGWQATAKLAPGHEPLPLLTGVTHTPCLRRDGSLLDTPGYDRLSGLAYMPLNGLHVVVPAAPTPADGAAAAAALLDLVAEFPWVSREDRNNFLAAWLTPLLMPMLTEPGPLLLINAPMQGSGKTLLSKILAATHGAVLRGNLPGDGEEQRKQLTSILTGTTAPVVVWDNVAGSVRSEHLASLTTKAVWTDRVLGSTQEVSVPAKRLLVLNGNNIVLAGDLARRGVWCTIDPRMPKPWERQGYKVANPDRWVERNRSEVLGHLLTMVRAWAVAGFPQPSRRTDSFAEWFAVCDGILQVCGVEGGVGRTELDVTVDTEEDDELHDLLVELWAVFGSDVFTTRAAAEACVGKGGGFSDVGRALPIELHDKLHAAAFQPAAVNKSLGRYLARVAGRWTSAGYSVVRVQTRDENWRKINAWRIARSGTPASPPSPVSNPAAGASTSTSTEPENFHQSSLFLGSQKDRGDTGDTGGPKRGVPLAFDFETSSASRLYEAPRAEFCRLLAVCDGERVWSTSDHDRMREWLDGASLLVGHNALNYDVHAAAQHLGMDFDALAAKTVDTLVLARLAEPPAAATDEAGKRNTDRLGYKLGDVAGRLGVPGKTGSVAAMATKYNRKAKLPDKFDAIPLDDPEYVAYVEGDARAAWAVWKALQPQCTPEYVEREMRLARIAAGMRRRGAGVDTALLDRRVADDDAEAERLTALLRDKLGAKVDKRLGKEAKERFGELMREAGIEPVLTATGAVSTEGSVLDGLAGRDDVVGELARAVRMLNGERGLPAQVRSWLGADGRLHPSIDIGFQASGRWSVTDPGLTTFGKRSEALLRDRDLVAARPGHLLYARDLSGIDVRGMAALSQDEAMIERLQPGLELDWHEQVADVVWGDPGRRKDAKALAHAINYNAGPGTIAAAAGVPYDEAAGIIARLHERFAGLAEFKRRVVAASEAGEVIRNGSWGRPLTVTVRRSHTQAPGLSGQGWARDATMECLLRLDDLGLARYVVLFVHDEFVFELPEDEVDRLVPLIAGAMTFERDGVPVLSEGSEVVATAWGDLYREHGAVEGE